MPGKSKKYYKKKAKSLKSQIKSEVKKALNSTIERKERRYLWSSIGGSNGNNTGTLSATSFASVSYGSGACVASLCAGIGFGTGEGQRTGTRIQLNSININLNVQNGDDTNYFRLILVRPRGGHDMSSVANFVAQVFTNNTSSGTQYGSPIDTNNYTIYMDKLVYLHRIPLTGTDATGALMNHSFKKFFKLNTPVEFDQTTTFPDRDFFLIAISDSAAVANPGAVSGFVKLTYTDA